MTDQNLIRVIDTAWDSRSEWKDATVELKDAVETVIAGLDDGTLRVAEKIDGNWVTNQWIKKAVLLSFRLTPNTLMTAGPAAYYDKVPLKFSGASAEDFAAAGVRFVPGAVARRGCFLEKGVILMPSFVNIGARVGKARWLIRGQQWGPALRWALTAIYRAAPVSAGFLNPFRPVPPSLKTTALSVRAVKSSKASSWKKIP